jgi:ABC-type nitrate/sulfonate/bicarbonate transport system permease component
MSYGSGAALQAAVYQRLTGSAAVTALVGAAIYDAVPPGDPPGVYIVLGPEDVRDASDASGAGAVHDFVVSVVTDAAGFQAAKAVAASVSEALLGATMALALGRLVGLWFLRARARRADRGNLRRIDLTFRARVEA